MSTLDKLAATASAVNAKLDPIYDTVLGKIAASKYSGVIVLAYSLGCFALGWWLAR